MRILFKSYNRNFVGCESILILIFLFLDYLAIIFAEQSAFILRNCLIPNGGILYISSLNYWCIFPLLYLLFMNIEQLYSCIEQFWQIIEKIFHAVLYAVVTIIILLYIGQIAASTSRLFVILLWLFSFIYLMLLFEARLIDNELYLLHSHQQVDSLSIFEFYSTYLHYIPRTHQ